jgi:hypothetical protein
MKTQFFATAALAAASLAVAAPASAQGLGPVQGYGNLGAAHISSDGDDFTTLGGRLGARFGNYLGLEGEAAFGVDGDKGTVAATPYSIKLKSAFASYAVGYYPVTPKFDLFARVGYGTSRVNAKSAGLSVTDNQDSWNYGGGGQYFFTAKDGVRADFTRESFTHGPGHANVWAASYVRKF